MGEESLEELVGEIEKTLWLRGSRNDSYEQEILAKSRSTLEQYYSYSSELAGEVVRQSTLYIDTCCQSAPGTPFPGFQSYCLQNIMTFYDKNNQNLSRLNPKFALTISKKVGAIVNSNSFSSVSFSFGLQSLTDRLTNFATGISPIISSRGTLYFLEHLDAKIKPGFRGGIEDCIFDRPDPEEVLLVYSEWSKLQQSDALGFGAALLREIGKRFLLPLPKTETRELMVDEEYLDAEWCDDEIKTTYRLRWLIEGIDFITKVCHLYHSYFERITELNFPVPGLVNLTMDFLDGKSYNPARKRFGEIKSLGILGGTDTARLERLFGVISKNKCPSKQCSSLEEALKEIAECASLEIHPDYQIVGKLCVSNMRHVYLAVYKEKAPEKELRVVKILRIPEEIEDLSLREKLECVVNTSIREWQALRRFAHDNVIRVWDSGTFEGRKYLVEEYVEGCSLKEYIQSKKYLPEGSVCFEREQEDLSQMFKIFSGVLSGLVYLHEKGYIHRDIKPANILVSSDLEQIKIDDLQTVIPADEAGSHPNNPYTRCLRGESYVAPELLGNGPASFASDIYSLGLSMYEFLVGTLNPLKLEETRTDKDEYNQNIGTAICRLRDMWNVIFKCLQYDPKERYQNAEECSLEFLRELRASLVEDPET